VLIASGHPQVFIPEDLGHGVNVGAGHAMPACRRVPEIMEVKIGDTALRQALWKATITYSGEQAENGLSVVSPAPSPTTRRISAILPGKNGLRWFSRINSCRSYSFAVSRCLWCALYRSETSAKVSFPGGMKPN
jgi:hypothetical protein